MSGKAKPHSSSQNEARHKSPKRKRSTTQFATPQKARRTVQEPDAQAFMEQFVENIEMTPTVNRTFVGPTPQKDGRVLGLFDMLSPMKADTTDAASPMKRVVLGTVDGNAAPTTPSKRTSLAPEVGATPENAGKYSRTPQSMGKRFMLDKFVTPSKRTRLGESGPDNLMAMTFTPTSMSNEARMFTPAFLRRENRVASTALEHLIEDDGDDTADGATERSPSKAVPQRSHAFAARQPGFGRTLSRSLSSMIADMRKAEDDHLDEEMDLLREVESGNTATGDKLQNHAAVSSGPPALLVEDSQKLGPDGASDSDESNAVPMDVRRRTWKKKGQKRQTRRVILKPIARLPKSTAASEAQRGINTKIEDDLDNAEEVLTETQLPDCDYESDEDENVNDDDDSDVSSNDGVSGTDDVESKLQTKKHTGVSKAAARVMPNNAASIANGLVDKVRKIGTTAHANYCRLKIRSAKGAAGAKPKGRFGRRK